jgi:hypothetical protein
MDERFVPAPATEAPPIGGESPSIGHGAGTPLDDPRALQILTTEHWSLLTARSLVYNEAFARGGMFLAFLSATLVVLGLISTGTGFSDAFLVVTAVVLGLDLFVGFATLGRIIDASEDDIRYIQGMNRLRHAYHEMTPGLEPYFITSGFDDFDSVLQHYGPTRPSALAGILHGLTTMPGMIGVISAAVGAGLSAVTALLVSHHAGLAAAAAVGGFVIVFALVTVSLMRGVTAFGTRMTVRFPKPNDAGRPPSV